MLRIREAILQHISQTFIECKQEQGFILGSALNIEQLDNCQQIMAVESGKYFYVPDGKQADIVIRNWAKQGICFCGFIHSHIVDQKDLSLNDIEFATLIVIRNSIPTIPDTPY